MFLLQTTAEKTARMGGWGWKIRKTWKVSSYHQLQEQQEQYQMKVTFWSSWKDFWRAARVWAAKLNQGWKEDRERKIHFDNGSPTIQKKVRIDKSFSSIKTHPGKYKVHNEKYPRKTKSYKTLAQFDINVFKI